MSENTSNTCSSGGARDKEFNLPSSIYFPQIFQINETVHLGKLRYGKDGSTSSIDEYLLKCVREKIGNKCIDLGYVSKDSISIVSRTLGQVNTTHFNGQVYYHVRCQANICKPVEGTQITAKVVDKNKIGLLAMQGPLYIYLPCAYLENAAVFETINVGTNVVIDIVNYSFQLNDSFIKVVGKYVHTA